MTVRLLFLNFTFLLFLAVSFSNFAYADYEKGLKAYRSGNYAIALKEFRESANQGDAQAQNNLGSMYVKGEGVPRDISEAVRWWRLAAEQGVADAQSILGFTYYRGVWGFRQDYTETLKWHRLAAAQGLASAQFNLGTMYANGEGVPKNDTEAVKWYRLAADQGHAKAQNNLGAMYHTGEGVPPDDAEAVRWYRLAAEQGDAGSQLILGGMYEIGQGVPQDYTEAVRWYRLVAEQGLGEAPQEAQQWLKEHQFDEITEAIEAALFDPLIHLQFPNASPFPPGVELVLERRTRDQEGIFLEYIPEGENIEDWSQSIELGWFKNATEPEPEPEELILSGPFPIGLLLNLQFARLQKRCQVADWNDFDNWIKELKGSQCDTNPTLGVIDEDRLTGEHIFLRVVPGQRHIYIIGYYEKTAGMSDEMRQTVLDWLEGITPRQ